ncbi:MAG: hypothetical protein KF810_23005 [Rhizobiaceae bacterium]|nr:hypothetical protein [Rhizobiaceae bacterium]
MTKSATAIRLRQLIVLKKLHLSIRPKVGSKCRTVVNSQTSDDVAFRRLLDCEHSMEGLIIKAEALETFAGMPKSDQMSAVFKPGEWSAQIAASVLRHARGGVS